MGRFDSQLDPPEPNIGVCCPFCGIELRESDTELLANGVIEWKCGVCGEAGNIEAEPEESDPVPDHDPQPENDPEPPAATVPPTATSPQP